MTKLAAKIQTRLNVSRDKGATAVEYGLMVALIAAVIIIGVTAIGNNSGATFNNVATKI
ncbi:Flp family type IVb pilin [Terrabacter sp. AAH1]